MHENVYNEIKIKAGMLSH